MWKHNHFGSPGCPISLNRQKWPQLPFCVEQLRSYWLLIWLLLPISMLLQISITLTSAKRQNTDMTDSGISQLRLSVASMIFTVAVVPLQNHKYHIEELILSYKEKHNVLLCHSFALKYFVPWALPLVQCRVFSFMNPQCPIQFNFWNKLDLLRYLGDILVRCRLFEWQNKITFWAKLGFFLFLP